MTPKDLLKLEGKINRTRADVAKVLVDNLNIEQDLADLVALDVATQALGTEAYNKVMANRLAIEKRERRRLRVEWLKDKWESVLDYKVEIIVTTVVLTLFSLIVFGVYSWATTPTYPRTYTPLDETTRFKVGHRTEDEKVPNGLDFQNFMCIKTGAGATEGKLPLCLHPKKLEEVTTAMDKAVVEDKNGVIWEGPNGNGEVWTIERNNYRFVITANKDENFKR